MKRAFTIVELMAVIILLTVISLVSFPIISNSIKKVSEKKDKELIRTLVSEANSLYNDYVLSDRQELIIDKNIFSELKSDKPDSGEIYINEYGNIGVAISIDEKCYLKAFDGDITLNQTGGCGFWKTLGDTTDPTVNFSILSEKHGDWYTSVAYVIIAPMDAESGVKSYSWCIGTNCTPENEELGSNNKTVYLTENSGTMVCAVAIDRENNQSDKACTELIKIDPNTVVADVEINGSTTLTLNSKYTNTISGYTYAWYKNDEIVNDSSSYTITSPGEYYLKLTNGAGISATSTKYNIISIINTTYNSNPAVAYAIHDFKTNNCIMKTKDSNMQQIIPYDVNTCIINE